MTGTPRVVPAGDAAWLLELEDRLDEEVNGRAVAIADAVAAARWPAARDVVVGYRTVTVYVDPDAEDAGAVPERLHALSRQVALPAPGQQPAIEVPVCYGGEFGPDLEDVARFGGCGTDEVVALHTSREYRVFMLGFVPGFPYMGCVDARIAAPRRQSPRVRVPAGSVGIAGAQTGIYPSETPGGWNLIGRTTFRAFDLARTPPCLLGPGSRVRFVPIAREEYDRLAR